MNEAIEVRAVLAVPSCPAGTGGKGGLGVAPKTCRCRGLAWARGPGSNGVGELKAMFIPSSGREGWRWGLTFRRPWAQFTSTCKPFKSDKLEVTEAWSRFSSTPREALYRAKHPSKERHGIHIPGPYFGVLSLVLTCIY